jgi:hypothetical protein
VAARQAEQATITAAGERGVTVSDTVDVRATRRIDEENMVKDQELRESALGRIDGRRRCLWERLLPVGYLTEVKSKTLFSLRRSATVT